jgi:hypothetical protein
MFPLQRTGTHLVNVYVYRDRMDKFFIKKKMILT